MLFLLYIRSTVTSGENFRVEREKKVWPAVPERQEELDTVISIIYSIHLDPMTKARLGPV
jgi:hypothetical protein